jgi:hypothetical protein
VIDNLFASQHAHLWHQYLTMQSSAHQLCSHNSMLSKHWVLATLHEHQSALQNRLSTSVACCQVSIVWVCLAF